MATKLRKLKITRVAVCDQGANPDADILLFKHADPLLTKNEDHEDEACTDPDCDDPDCPVHGDSIDKDMLVKGPIGEMAMHGEPDGDEATPLDYATRGRQYDLWEQLWCKWEQFCATFYDVIGDADDDNIPHLPILVRSIGQFQEDVAALLDGLGLVEKAAPAFALLAEVQKAGAVMAGHRKARLEDAIQLLQALLDEASPVVHPDHGITMPFEGTVMTHPATKKGAIVMADTVEGITKRAEAAEALVKDLAKKLDDAVAAEKTAVAKVAELEPLAGRVTELEATIEDMKLSPEDQVAKYWQAQPEAIRKAHEADELEKADLKKRLALADERAEQSEYIAKTATFRGFGLAPDHWNLLRAIEKRLDEPERDELLRLMQAAANQTKTAALYTSFGSSGVGNGQAGGTAEQQLLALAKIYKDEHKCDDTTAQLAVAAQHRELYDRSVMEKRRHTRVSSD